MGVLLSLKVECIKNEHGLHTLSLMLISPIAHLNAQEYLLKPQVTTYCVKYTQYSKESPFKNSQANLTPIHELVLRIEAGGPKGCDS